ncbi:MAG: hypothetical protein D6746_06280 [Bacteroidetes bacterium]|nr:MAG: hypothetical protein D6746_06280 [Bacteroidota bacterium]
MEAHENQAPIPEAPRPLPGGIGPSHQLASDTTRVGRIARHTRGLVEDVKEWIELRMQLVQAQIEERVEERINQAVLAALVAGVALLALVFALVAASLGLGAWLGHPAWGFLIVASVLLLLALVLHRLRPRMVRRRPGKRQNDAQEKTSPRP